MSPNATAFYEGVSNVSMPKTPPKQRGVHVSVCRPIGACAKLAGNVDSKIWLFLGRPHARGCLGGVQLWQA